MLTLMRTGWGQENPAFRQFFTSLFIPGASAEQMDWFNNLQRITTSAENAVKMRLVSDYMNVVNLLPQVKAPTLVMHCRDDAVQPFEEGRRIAAAIPNARFVALDGRNHLILETDPGWPRFQSEMQSFLAS
jgi:pimeloyl-ACP methyl ester carboxylesterase